MQNYEFSPGDMLLITHGTPKWITLAISNADPATLLSLNCTSKTCEFMNRLNATFAVERGNELVQCEPE